MLSHHVLSFNRRKRLPLRKMKTKQEEEQQQKILQTLLLAVKPVKLGLSDSDSDYSSSDESHDEDESQWSDCDDSATTDALNVEILNQLHEAALNEHLEFDLKPRTPSTVKSMLGRYSNFIAWLYNNNLDDYVEGRGGVNVAALLKNTILINHQVLVKYYKYLKDSVLLMSSTIYNYNEEMLILFNWFSVFRKSSDEYKVMPTDLYAINIVIVAMRKLYSQQRASEACTSNLNTQEGLKKARKWPERGLSELDGAVKRELPWARTVASQMKISNNNRTMYNHFMQVCLSSLYTGCLYMTEYF
jgi:hypothetical protein